MASGIPRYAIKDCVGRGGFGAVFQAIETNAGGFTRQVAVKLLNEEAARHPEFARRLRDEARILGLLRHRAIVGVHGLAQLGRQPAIVMEFVPGIDLGRLLDSPLPVRVALRIAEEIASALAYVHASPSPVTGRPLNLVHRDVKPGNIRITPQGQVKLLDFGIARAAFAAQESSMQDLLMGSPRYMAPERHVGQEEHASDVFALGVVLVRMLGGFRTPEPPLGDPRFSIWRQGLLDVVEHALSSPPTDTSLGVQREIVALVSSTLALDPDERPFAAQVELACRRLQEVCTGPLLREWAEREVPVEVQVQVDQGDSGTTATVVTLRNRRHRAAS
jgi:eukaryotic-like serine/threonine-protein kinase